MKYNLPNIRSLKDLEDYFPNVEIISNYNTYEKFDEFYYKIYYAICACFEIKECKQFYLKFKFYHHDEETYALPLNKMILNLNVWRPLIELNNIQKYYNKTIEILDSKFIASSMMSKTVRVNLEIKVLQILNDYGISFERTSELIKTVIERYQELSIEFSLINQSSIITLENIFLNDYIHNKKVQELNNLKIPEDMQTSDVENLLKDKMKILVNELGETKNPIWYISKAGKAIKDKQLQELFISYGQVPDVYGNVIPYTMKGNGFSTGYTDIPTYYVAATGARLSAIMNKEFMGKAGYLSRNLVLASRTISLSNKIYDCGTKHLLKITVTDHNFLKRLENKWYCEHLGDPLQLIHYDDCKHLIGKTIHIRSIITCAAGDEVCHVCYGQDSHLVMNMPGMGVFNTEVFSSFVSQNILSTKHLLFTNANTITYNENFQKYFKFISGDIFIKDENELNIENLSNYLLRIPEENITPINDYDMIECNTFGNNVNSPIYMYIKSEKRYEEILIVNYKSMFVDANSMKFFNLVTDRKQQRNYFEISLDSLVNDLDGRLLSISIKNNGLTDNLHDIMDMVNKNAPKYPDYHSLAQDMFDLITKANIPARHVQTEIILNRLIRDPENLYERPDFKKFEVPEYKILTLNQALLKSKAPTVSLSFQEIKRQLLSEEFYQKEGSSYMDPLYSSEIPTDHFKELVKERIAKENARRTEKSN